MLAYNLLYKIAKKPNIFTSIPVIPPKYPRLELNYLYLY